MEIVRFEDLELHIDENGTLSTNEVAKGYGISSDAIRLQKKRHSDKLLKNIHFIEVWDEKFKRYITRWTLEGVHMLGFFIKSERAKEFRKFTAKLLTEIKKGNAQVIPTARGLSNTGNLVPYSRYKSTISSLAARIGHYKRLYNEARERNAKLMERIRHIESRSVGCKELKSILSKGLKYDELEEKYKKLITEYEVLKAKLDVARQYNLSSLESITALIKKGADIDTKKLPKQ